MNKLICNDVCKSFRIGNDNLNVLNNINLTIEQNDTIDHTNPDSSWVKLSLTIPDVIKPVSYTHLTLPTTLVV